MVAALVTVTTVDIRRPSSESRSPAVPAEGFQWFGWGNPKDKRIAFTLRGVEPGRRGLWQEWEQVISQDHVPNQEVAGSSALIRKLEPSSIHLEIALVHGNRKGHGTTASKFRRHVTVIELISNVWQVHRETWQCLSARTRSGYLCNVHSVPVATRIRQLLFC